MRDVPVVLDDHELGWDVRVLRLEQRQLWWWNAWHEATSTELSGTARTRDEAQRDLDAAVADTIETVSLDVHRQRRAW